MNFIFTPRYTTMHKNRPRNNISTTECMLSGLVEEGEGVVIPIRGDEEATTHGGGVVAIMVM